MSSLPLDASLEDIIEELKIQEELLESLEEERPYATDEREELLETINGLKERLAILRNEPLPEDSDSSLPSPDSPPPQSDDEYNQHSRQNLTSSKQCSLTRASSSPRSNSLTSGLPLIGTPLPTRKRQHLNSDLNPSDDRLTKRAASTLEPSPSPGPAATPSLDNQNGLSGGSQALAELLGFDKDEFDEVYEGHLTVEKRRRDEGQNIGKQMFSIFRDDCDDSYSVAGDSVDSGNSVFSESSSRSMTPDSSEFFRRGPRHVSLSSKFPTVGSARPISVTQGRAVSKSERGQRYIDLTANNSNLGGMKMAGADHQRKLHGSSSDQETKSALSSASSSAAASLDVAAINQQYMLMRQVGRRDESSTERLGSVMSGLRQDEKLLPAETPKSLKDPLYPHQQLGLTWMTLMEESRHKGGILGDDMGLGKTIQTLSLIVSRQSPDRERKTTLIVAPVALMYQWRREIESKLKPGRHQLRVFVLHSMERGTKSATFEKLKQYDVVLTTYGTLTSELKKRELWDRRLSQGVRASELTKLISIPILGHDSQWYRVILDEAQQIRNYQSKSGKACAQIKSIYRWCLSGTPMQNGVHELYPLLRFLSIAPYNSKKMYDEYIARPLKRNQEDSASYNAAMDELRILLRGIMLRRTKTSEIHGKPILQLPRKIVEEVHAVFDTNQREWYDSLEGRLNREYDAWSKEAHHTGGLSFVFLLLLRLRQGCCHQHLIEQFAQEFTGAVVDDAIDLVSNAKAFSQEIINRLKDNEELTCPICLDTVPNPIIFFPCGHSTCPECFGLMEKGPANQDFEEGAQLKCPHCRTHLDPKKLTDNLTFRKVHFGEPEHGASGDVAEEESEEDDDDEEYGDDDDEDGGTRQKGKRKETAKKKKKKTDKLSLSELKKEASRNLASKRKYLKRLQKIWIPSAKIDKTLELLEEIQGRGMGEKTIIFCSFTTLLDLLEIPMRRKDWSYVRYDGSMNIKERNAAVEQFTDDPDCRIMLVSIKAGNAGLNLTAATQVILFDPNWNPYVEDQAVDRAHRIGQRSEVHVHRLVIQGTVEDRILELQQRKRAVIEEALDDESRQNATRLTHAELRYLIGYRPGRQDQQQNQESL